MATYEPNLFLSWSGDRSKVIAQALHDWLPTVIQSVKPWMSDIDIERGARWTSDIVVRLSQCRIGILCLTPENLESPWLIFEAGALSKSLEPTFVCPYLFQLEPTDLNWPLAMFQCSQANQEGTRKLLKTIRNAIPDTLLTDHRLDAIFDALWPSHSKHLDGLRDQKAAKKQLRGTPDSSDEILNLLRAIASDRSFSAAAADIVSRLQDIRATLADSDRQIGVFAVPNVSTTPVFSEQDKVLALRRARSLQASATSAPHKSDPGNNNLLPDITPHSGDAPNSSEPDKKVE